jgi:hypothetical protein
MGSRTAGSVAADAWNNEQKADTMKTYILRDPNPVEPQNGHAQPLPGQFTNRRKCFGCGASQGTKMGAQKWNLVFVPPSLCLNFAPQPGLRFPYRLRTFLYRLSAQTKSPLIQGAKRRGEFFLTQMDEMFSRRH